MKIYRDAWKAAGHPGQGRVMLAFHMFCAETREKAAAIAREPLNIYLQLDRQRRVGLDVGRGVEGLSELSEDDRDSSPRKPSSRRSRRAAPGSARRTISASPSRPMTAQVGGFESASLQVNFGMIGQADAEQSMTLFAREVMPHFKN